MAKRKRKSEMAGSGCLVQVVGLLVIWWFPIGTVVGLVLLVWGSQLALYWVCSNCGNRLGDKGVKMCPVCKEVIE